MTYILDFDRTLFDLDAFYRYLLEKPACEPFAGEIEAALRERTGHTAPPSEERTALMRKITDVIADGTLTFSPGELSRFVYEDVPEFLRNAGNDAIVITCGDPVRQRAKVRSALSEFPDLIVWYVGEPSKAEYLAGRTLGTAPILVDDYTRELERVAAARPDLALYEMRRNEGAGDGRWPVIRSLNEIPRK